MRIVWVGGGRGGVNLVSSDFYWKRWQVDTLKLIFAQAFNPRPCYNTQRILTASKKVMGSMFIAKDVKDVHTAAMSPNRRNSLPCTVMTSRQRSSNQRVGCLLCSVVRTYKGSQDLRQVCRSGRLLRSVWISSLITATPHRNRIITSLLF